MGNDVCNVLLLWNSVRDCQSEDCNFCFLAVQGICRMTNEKYSTVLPVVRLWAHEADRVFSDRLVNDSDKAKYNVLRAGVCGKYFHDLPMVWTARDLVTQDKHRTVKCNKSHVAGISGRC